MTETSFSSGAIETVKAWAPRGKPKKLKKKKAINPIPGRPGKYYDDASDRVVRKPR